MVSGAAVRLAYATHIGHLPRKQQDALLVGDRVIQAPAVQPTVEDVQAEDCLIAVADGVTLGPAGEIASRTLLEILAELWRGSRAKVELRPLSSFVNALSASSTNTRIGRNGCSSGTRASSDI